MFRHLVLAEEAGQDVIEFTLLIAVVVITTAAIFPFSTDAIASICALAEKHLNKAMQSSWQ
jgi:hypothetical protein